MAIREQQLPGRIRQNYPVKLGLALWFPQSGSAAQQPANDAIVGSRQPVALAAPVQPNAPGAIGRSLRHGSPNTGTPGRSPRRFCVFSCGCAIACVAQRNL